MLTFQYVRHDDVETLGEFLIRRFHYHTQYEWSDLIQKGLVRIGSKHVLPSRILETKDLITYDRPYFVEPTVDENFSILYEDNNYVAVDKPGNIPTSPSGKYWYNCLTNLLKRVLKSDELHPAHRLDRETSGVNLFAKNKTAAKSIGMAFSKGEVGKEYFLIARGKVNFRSALVSSPLGKDSSGPIRIKQAVCYNGRRSFTHFKVLAIFPGSTLLSVRPLSGRTHQIRVHSNFLGHPTVNDKLYGTDSSEFINWINKSGLDPKVPHCLHSRHLRFFDPFSNKLISITSPVTNLIRNFSN